MSWQQFVVLAGAHFLALLSPGPDFFLLINHSLGYGRRAGYQTALGIACANGVFIIAALCGVTWLQRSPLTYALMYWSGCAYLAWLGMQFWRGAASSGSVSVAPAERSDFPAFFGRGFASGILNPKNAMFYLTLFTVLAGKDTTMLGRGVAAAWMVAVVLVWDCSVSWLFTQPRTLAAFSRYHGLLHRAGAVVLVGIAAGLVVSWR